jgi:hypothetical protein
MVDPLYKSFSPRLLSEISRWMSPVYPAKFVTEAEIPMNSIKTLKFVGLRGSGSGLGLGLGLATGIVRLLLA